VRTIRWPAWRRRNPEPDLNHYQVLVALHAIQCRLDVSLCRAEVRRDAAEQRHELQAELRRLDDGGSA
jgi:hypothetical protein